MRRVPWLTLSVLALTAVVNTVQLVVPGTLAQLERTPAVRHGEPWRVLTSLLVQDGRVAGAIPNLLGLVVLGLLAERVVSRRRWLVAYLGAGLAGEIAGVLWQPVGGGNSVAVCGLAAVAALACFEGDPTLPEWAALPVLLWTASLVTTSRPALFVPVVVVALLLGTVGRAQPWLRYVVLLGAITTALALVADRNIHGAALAAGLVLAALSRGVLSRMAG